MTIEVGNRKIEISKRDKVLFPDGITKKDLAEYYERVSEIMFPLARDRAITMHRFPDGIEEGGFYQKEAPDYFPDWITTKSLAKEDGEVEHVVLEDPATLVYLADQACITPHIWLSRVDKPDHPDRMVFDLDPAEGSEDLERLHDSALKIRRMLEDLDLTSLLMTTGSAGYHIVVPLDRSADFDTVRDVAHRLADLAADRYADQLTTATRKAKREGRIFVDYLRNAYAQTTVAPYAVRALPGAPVATPLDWDELGDSRPRKYTMGSLFQRLGQKEDPWAGLPTDAGHSMSDVRDRIEPATGST